MPQQFIEVPGQGEIEFPDSMSDADIVNAIKRLSAPAETSPLSFGRDVVRGATQQGGNILRGLRDIGGAAVDVFNKSLSPDPEMLPALLKGFGQGAVEGVKHAFTNPLEFQENITGIRASGDQPIGEKIGATITNVGAMALPFAPRGIRAMGRGSRAAPGVIEAAEQLSRTGKVPSPEEVAQAADQLYATGKPVPGSRVTGPAPKLEDVLTDTLNEARLGDKPRATFMPPAIENVQPPMLARGVPENMGRAGGRTSAPRPRTVPKEGPVDTGIVNTRETQSYPSGPEPEWLTKEQYELDRAARLEGSDVDISTSALERLQSAADVSHEAQLIDWKKVAEIILDDDVVTPDDINRVMSDVIDAVEKSRADNIVDAVRSMADLIEVPDIRLRGQAGPPEPPPGTTAPDRFTISPKQRTSRSGAAKQPSSFTEDISLFKDWIRGGKRPPNFGEMVESLPEFKGNLFRGERLPEGTTFKPGDTVDWPDYRSTSKSLDAANTFSEPIPGVNDVPTLFDIQNGIGRDLAGHLDEYESTAEVLSRGKFGVESVEMAPDGRMVVKLRPSTPDRFSISPEQERSIGTLEELDQLSPIPNVGRGTFKEIVDEPPTLSDLRSSVGAGSAASDPRVMEAFQEAGIPATRGAVQDITGTPTRWPQRKNEAELDDAFSRLIANEKGALNFGDMWQGLKKKAGFGGPEPEAIAKDLSRFGRRNANPKAKQLDRAPRRPFRDRIMDEEGVIGYHGTDNVFDAFDDAFVGKRTDPGFFGRGVYLVDDEGNASRWGKHVIKAEANLRNPLEVTGMSDWIAKTGQRKTEGKKAYAEEIARITEDLKSKGYDGVKITRSDGVNQYVVFDSSGIKILSHTGRRGLNDETGSVATDILKTAGRTANQLRVGSMLSGLALPKSLLGNLGAVGTASIEHGSTAPIREMLRFPTNAREARAAWRENANPANIHGAGRVNVPGRLIGATDATSQKLLERAGLSADEAQRLLLTRHNTAGKALGIDNPIGRVLWPFQKTPFNQLREGMSSENWSSKKRAALSVGAGGAGALLGEQTDDPRILGLAAALSGPRGLPFLLGAGFGGAGRNAIAGISPIPEWGIPSDINGIIRLTGVEPAAIRAFGPRRVGSGRTDRANRERTATRGER